MKWANRMICGHCSREQRYSPHPCQFCGTVLTKHASRGGFWEGGEGTRNQSLMNRHDPRKYRGLGKTQSRRDRKNNGS